MILRVPYSSATKNARKYSHRQVHLLDWAGLNFNSTVFPYISSEAHVRMSPQGILQNVTTVDAQQMSFDHVSSFVAATGGPSSKLLPFTPFSCRFCSSSSRASRCARVAYQPPHAQSRFTESVRLFERRKSDTLWQASIAMESRVKCIVFRVNTNRSVSMGNALFTI